MDGNAKREHAARWLRDQADRLRKVDPKSTAKCERLAGLLEEGRADEVKAEYDWICEVLKLGERSGAEAVAEVVGAVEP